MKQQDATNDSHFVIDTGQLYDEMESFMTRLQRFVRSLVVIAGCLYAPYLVFLHELLVTKDAVLFPLLPGWITWFAIPRGHALQLAAAAIVTLGLVGGLTVLGMIDTSTLIFAAIIAVLYSIPTAALFWFFARIAGVA